MSLLMQALKKAERAKQNSIPETELEKPSEAFDELLALTPQETAAPASAGSDFMLDLEPLDGPVSPAAPAPAAGTPPAAHAPAAEPSLEPLSFETEPPIPVLSIAEEAIHDPVPPQARQQEQPRPAPPPAAQAAAQTAQTGQQATGSRLRGAAKPDAPRGAARARAAAAAAMSNDGAGLDPAKVRLAVLSGVAVLIAAVFGYIYWQATTSPGPGARLPMVPMPPPGATGAAPAQLVVAPADAAHDDAGSAPAAAAAAAAPAPAAAAAPATAAAPAAPAATAAPAAPVPPHLIAAGPVSGGGPEEYERLTQQQQQREALAQQAFNNQQMQNMQQLGGAHPTPAPDTLAPLAAPDSSDIKVTRSNVAPQVDPSVQAAYQAFSSGDLARAQQQYEQALRTDPNNRDALLGSAAVALRQRQDQQAAAIYSRLLELDPNDGDALAGLMGLRQGDASQAESRLRIVLTRTPDAAPVQFALGNLYARQGRWPEAQQAYFRAWSAAPGNADYAYNLAIGLDRLNQGKLAVTYYQKALALAQDAPASFDRAALRLRLHQLSQLNQPAHPGQP